MSPHPLQPSSSDDTDGQEELERAVIVSCSEVWQDLYHFVTPLRACNLPADRLKPLVLLLEKECVIIDCLDPSTFTQ